MGNGRTFEDVIFGAILGVWSTRVASLWAPGATWRSPVAFLAMAAILALALKLTWEIPSFPLRLLGTGWMAIAIFVVSYEAAVAGLFSKDEATVFALVFGFWYATALLSDGVLRLYRRP